MCMECAAAYREANRAKQKEYMREYYRKNGDACDWRLRKRYGITATQYDAMLREQDGRCFICRGVQDGYKKRLSVDHDHSTGRVRKLLCNGCNQALGHAKDNPEILDKLALYIRSHRN